MPSGKEKEKILINAIKHMLKSNDVVKRMFLDFGESVDILDSIPVEFADMKASAKTKGGKVFLNKKLLEDGDFSQDIHYIVHEANHWLQQKHNSVKDYDIDDDTDYLDLPFEVEAFRNQVKFMSEFYGEKDADDYVEELLDFHELAGKERARKKKEIMG